VPLHREALLSPLVERAALAVVVWIVDQLRDARFSLAL